MESSTVTRLPMRPCWSFSAVSPSGFRRDMSFLLGVGLFTAASAACAVANGVAALVAFRVVQAAGAALMTPTSLGLLLASFPPAGRGGAVRAWTAIGGFAAALGPLAGGVADAGELALDLSRQRADRDRRPHHRLVEATGSARSRRAESRAPWPLCR